MDHSVDLLNLYPDSMEQYGLELLLEGTYVGSVLVTDRYIRLMFASAVATPSKKQAGRFDIKLNQFSQVADPEKTDPNCAINFIYPDYTRPTLRDTYHRALKALRDACPGTLSSVTVGFCLGLDSSLSIDRFRNDNIPEHHRQAYGRARKNTVHPAWSGFNFYSEALRVFEKQARYVYVRADVSLAAMGVYYNRIQSWSRRAGFRIAPDLHLAKFEQIDDQYERAERGRHTTLAYVKLSSEVNIAVIYNGELLGGMNHASVNSLRPRPHLTPVRVVRERVNLLRYRYDEFGDCDVHKQCYSGLVSERALIRRLGLEAEVYSGEKVVRPIELDSHPHKEEFRDLVSHYVMELVQTIVATHNPTVIVFGGRLVNDRRGYWPNLKILENVELKLAKYLDLNGDSYPNSDYLNLRCENARLDRPSEHDLFQFLQIEKSDRSAPRGGCVFSAKALCGHRDASIEFDLDQIESVNTVGVVK